MQICCIQLIIWRKNFAKEISRSADRVPQKNPCTTVGGWSYDVCDKYVIWCGIIGYFWLEECVACIYFLGMTIFGQGSFAHLKGEKFSEILMYEGTAFRKWFCGLFPSGVTRSSSFRLLHCVNHSYYRMIVCSCSVVTDLFVLWLKTVY